jgi:hypothetical protein
VKYVYICILRISSDFGSALESLHHLDVGSAADVSEEIAAPIFRVELHNSEQHIDSEPQWKPKINKNYYITDINKLTT